MNRVTSKYGTNFCILLIFISLSIVYDAFGQGLIKPEIMQADTTELKKPEIAFPALRVYNILNGILNTESPIPEFKLNLPDFNSLLNSRWIIRSAPGDFSEVFIPAEFSGIYSPYFQSGTILNQASYNISDKITIGGYSYGARSIFSAPLPGSLTNKFDTRGAAMYFQYKVTSKFRIEAGININQGPKY